jgi:hypothetical protein
MTTQEIAEVAAKHAVIVYRSSHVIRGGIIHVVNLRRDVQPHGIFCKLVGTGKARDPRRAMLRAVASMPAYS